MWPEISKDHLLSQEFQGLLCQSRNGSRAVQVTKPNASDDILQIENEYGSVQAAYGEAGKRYAYWAADMAKSLNAGVPWIMCQQPDAPGFIVSPNNVLESLISFLLERLFRQYCGPNCASKIKSEPVIEAATVILDFEPQKLKDRLIKLLLVRASFGAACSPNIYVGSASGSSPSIFRQVNTCNGFYCDNFQPHRWAMPKMWTENWDGWYAPPRL